MELPKIKGLAELKGESYCNHFDAADVSPTWRQRLLKWISPLTFKAAFDVRRENDHLRARLLEALRACEDAGRVGLMLYAENEELREQVETTPQQRLVRLHDLDQLANENRNLRDKLKRAYSDHDRLREEMGKWINQFGKPKE